MARGAWPMLPQKKIPTEPGLAGANAGGAVGLGPLKPAAASLPGWEPQQSSHCLGVSTLAPRSRRRRSARLSFSLSLPLFPALR